MKRFRNILVIADEASASDALFARAKWLASANGARLTLLDVVESEAGALTRLISLARPRAGSAAAALEEQVLAIRRDRLETLAVPLRADGLDVATVVAQGAGFIMAIRHVLTHQIDLVLKGARREPETRTLHGADLHLLRKCPCPVWVLASSAEPSARRVLAAVDPGEGRTDQIALGRDILSLATALAEHDGAQLDVVHAWHVHEEATLRHEGMTMSDADVSALLDTSRRQSELALDAMIGTLQADRMRVLHVKGNPADVVTEHAAAERTDTLVMSTVMRTGLPGFLIGDTAETILSRVGCSILAVKPKGFISPVTTEGDMP